MGPPKTYLFTTFTDIYGAFLHILGNTFFTFSSINLGEGGTIYIYIYTFAYFGEYVFKVFLQ